MAEREVKKVSDALGEVAAFDASRNSTTRALADLTRALPEESALVTLRLAGESGSLVALAPRAAAVLGALENVRGVESAEIVGPVTREVVAGKAIERLTVRFRIGRDARKYDARPPAGTE